MIYLDNNATTEIAEEVFEAMKPYLTNRFGNPSAVYDFAREAREIVDVSRQRLADLVGAENSTEIVFTSCGTESDNWAILGALGANPEKRHIITTKVEHSAISNLCKKLEQDGVEVTTLGVDENGSLDLDELRGALRPETAVVSVMMANNETGIIFPVKEIAEIVHSDSDAVFHVDGVNAVGKIPVNVREAGIDLFSISGHKFHAPKGIGALYIRRGVKLAPMLIGGSQESGRRAGTEAVHQIAAIGKAAELAKSPGTDIRRLRDKLEDFILRNIPNARLNGTAERSVRLPNTSSISFENINGEMILARLNELGICVSTGSACNSESRHSSSVLQAMNVPFTTAMGAVRFSLGRYNTEAEIDFVIEHLPKIIEELRQQGI